MLKFLLSTLCLLFAAPAAQAATIDFSSLSPGLQGSDTLVFPEATFISPSGDFNVQATTPISICATATGGCFFDFEVVFAEPVDEVSIDLLGAGAQDAVTISAFDDLDNFLGDGSASGASAASILLPFSGIARIEIDDMSSPSTGGYLYANFEYLPIPEPATGVLFMGGLMGLASRRHPEA